jgi:dsDNA-binding SOS-regulon protein
MVDRNRLWEAMGVKFPPYQILPETNHVSYVKNNILASIYTIGKSAKLLPTSVKDKDIIENLNIALEYIWSQLNVPLYQMRAGERAALLNLGVTQVGWDNSITVGSGDAFEKGRCKLKNINPLKYMRDPFADSLDTAGYVMTWDWFHKSVLLSNPNYKESFAQYLAEHKDGMAATTTNVVDPPSDRFSTDGNGKKDYYKVIYHWVRVGNKIHEIHTIDNNYVLYVKENIRPNTFPFSELYCNLPTNDIVGVSEPNKILAYSIAYNLMNSIILTAEYKNQRPPKFINQASGINIPAFIQHGDDADKTFPINGDASKAVHYHQFPQPSAAATIELNVLSSDIKNISGIDDRYTGRDTGSILTTGGINDMLSQVTMIDAPKISNYEDYSKRLTQLIISNYIINSAIVRKYFIKDRRTNAWKSVSVDFPSIDNDTLFAYELVISSELPKNKGTIANMANKLMEMQMQYSSQNLDVDLIQPEEWLMCQDLPMREYMQERMGVQRNQSWIEATSQIVTQYAGLIENNVPPKDAVLQVANTMQAQSMPGGVDNSQAPMV